MFSYIFYKLQGKTIEEIASMIQNPSKHRSFFQNVQPRIKKQRTCTLTQEKTQEKELQVSVVASFSRCSSSSSWSKPRRKNSFTKLNSFKLSKRWQLDLSKCIDASALIVQVALKKKWKTLIYIGSHASRFVCVHFDTGKIVWEQQLDDRIEASASVSHPLGLVYIGTYSGRLYALHLLTGQVSVFLCLN
jgi:hypothetical protein